MCGCDAVSAATALEARRSDASRLDPTDGARLAALHRTELEPPYSPPLESATDLTNFEDAEPDEEFVHEAPYHYSTDEWDFYF